MTMDHDSVKRGLAPRASALVRILWMILVTHDLEVA